MAPRLRALLHRALNDARLSTMLLRHPLAYGRWYRYGQRRVLRARRRVWVIAAEMAQVHVAIRFVREVRARHPQLGFVVSVPNRLARQIVERELEVGTDVVTYVPFPISVLMWRALRIIEPLSVVFLLNNLGPTIAWLAKRRGIRVALVGAEAPTEYPEDLLPLAVDGIHVLCPRSARDRDALVALGFDAARMCVTGSPKFDSVMPVGMPLGAELRQAGLDESHLILVGGSLAPGEEQALLDVYVDLKPRFANLGLILAPRATQDAAAFVDQIARRGLVGVLRSRVRTGATVVPAHSAPVLVLDTYGELRRWYACAAVVFVGRSLTARSGSNLMEPAGYGKAIVVGPYFDEFAEELQAFLEEDAVRQIADVHQLQSTIDDLLAHADVRDGYGRRARGVIAQHAGALRRAVDFLDTQGLW
jgi:3-deoxy-D-manno-octulosonic-acid transferase